MIVWCLVSCFCWRGDDERDGEMSADVVQVLRS
jgi:hypothetical protein